MSVQVHVRHIGDMRFKGVPGIHRVVDITSSATCSRTFPTQPPNSKGKLLQAGSGLQYIVERRVPAPAEHRLPSNTLAGGVSLG